jgi:KUP system potassium uptake protein
MAAIRILLVATFRSSSALGAAYGLAVSGVMVITSIAMFRVARLYWTWGPAETGLVWGALLVVNAAFLVACLLKFVEGGY